MMAARSGSDTGTILVTGATGYIGGQLVRRLVAGGVRARCLVLPDDPAEALRSLPVEIVRGDVTQLASLLPHGQGVAAIVHAAALMLPNPADRILSVNIEGTANVIRFAREAGIARFVYLSAVSAVYARKNAYGRSKQEAERLVVASSLDYTILRLTMVYGADGGLHFWKLVDLVDHLPFVFPIPGPGTARLQPVRIEDVLAAIEAVLRQPVAIGKTYNVSGASALSFNEFVDQILAARGAARLKLHAPLWLCLLAARARALLPGASFLSTESLLALNEDATLDHAELRRDCGYAPVGIEAGLRAALSRLG